MFLVIINASMEQRGISTYSNVAARYEDPTQIEKRQQAQKILGETFETYRLRREAQARQSSVSDKSHGVRIKIENEDSGFDPKAFEYDMYLIEQKSARLICGKETREDYISRKSQQAAAAQARAKEAQAKKEARAQVHDRKQEARREKIARGEHIETPQEYADRKARQTKEHEQRLESYSRENAKKLGIGTEGSVCDILRRVGDKKDQIKESQKRSLQKRTAERFQLSTQEVEKFSHAQMKGMHQSANLQAKDDVLIHRAMQRKSGERVSYQESLAERHAYARAGVFDASLSQHSDEKVVEYAQQTQTHTVAEVNAGVKVRMKKK